MKKEKLIIELKKERDLFALRCQDTTEHDLAISYLETGKLPFKWERFDLVYAAKEDFETLCLDYGVKH